MARKPQLLNRPPLSVDQILAWADAFQERYGRWPHREDGTTGLPDGNWGAVDQCLKLGLRGLTHGSSLAKLLRARRGRRHKGLLPRLGRPLILRWADAHHARAGDWPHVNSGAVADAPGETWAGVNAALQSGGRGLAGGTSLAQLLQDARGVRNRLGLADLSVEDVLAWADAHRARAGAWPKRDSGPIPEAAGETWNGIDAALGRGTRGLPQTVSLPGLLELHRGVRNPNHLPRLEEWEILIWADAHHARSSEWPTEKGGPIPEAAGETWRSVDAALRAGTRGLPGGDSLGLLLKRRRGVAYAARPPALGVGQVLAWADAHRRRTGAWPTRASGPVAGAPGETWAALDSALKAGSRGLPGGLSLARLLATERGVRNPAAAPRLTIEQVLSWADDHHGRTGGWPKLTSGAVAAAPGETWSGVNAALWAGTRGVPGGQSLARLLAEHRGARNHRALPRLTTRQIVAWADNHHALTGRWPAVKSGPIAGAAGETWSGVNAALERGLRGLPGGDSLARLLARRRGR